MGRGGLFEGEEQDTCVKVLYFLHCSPDLDVNNVKAESRHSELTLKKTKKNHPQNTTVLERIRINHLTCNKHFMAEYLQT